MLHNTGIHEILSDEEEEAILSDLESSDEEGGSKSKHPLARLARASFFSEGGEEEDEWPTKVESVPKIDDETKALIRRRVTDWLDEVSKSRLELAFNLSCVIMNARKAKHEWKQRGLVVVLQKSRAFGHLLNKFLFLIFPNRKDLAFRAAYSALFAELQIADRMVGDPFLLNVLRGMKRVAKGDEEQLQLLDLLLCCGDDVSDEIIALLKRVNRLEVTFAVYMRIVGIYYFRYHRDVDRKALRDLLKAIRVVDKSRLLPKL